jgi:hypothetical protein
MPNLSESSVPGLTAPNTGLAEAESANLVEQPIVGNSLDERLAHFGSVPPTTPTVTALAAEGNISNPGVGSILPWTPHPQHSYKDNSNRVMNRTGKERPSYGS